jgi:hypothetical protein
MLVTRGDRAARELPRRHFFGYGTEFSNPAGKAVLRTESIHTLLV